MREYLDAVRTVLKEGLRKENRTCVDTLSTFNVNYNIDMSDGSFPLLTTKKVSWKNIVAENLWFLSGEPHIGILQKHGCKFWDAWADKYGRVPSAYGNLWREFPVHEAQAPIYSEDSAYAEFDAGYNDQIKWVIDEIKRNPMSRRLVVSAWAPGNAQTSKLPPCHLLMVFNVQHMRTLEKCINCRGTGQAPVNAAWNCSRCEGSGRQLAKTEPRLCLHLTQRSADIALGVPYNIAGYGFLLSLMSRFTGIKPGTFGHTLIDAHAYTSKPDGSMAEYDHVPGLEEQLARAPRVLPKLVISDAIQELSDLRSIMDLDTEEMMSHFVLKDYHPWPAINFKVAV